MKTTHSPGPWKAATDHHRTNKRKRMALVATTNGRMSIDCTESDETYAPDCANARLIAEAPAMAALLARLVYIWPQIADPAIDGLATEAQTLLGRL